MGIPHYLYTPPAHTWRKHALKTLQEHILLLYAHAYLTICASSPAYQNCCGVSLLAGPGKSIIIPPDLLTTLLPTYMHATPLPCLHTHCMALLDRQKKRKRRKKEGTNAHTHTTRFLPSLS